MEARASKGQALPEICGYQAPYRAQGAAMETDSFPATHILQDPVE